MYVHSILHHWVCILIYEGHFIEYGCYWEFVCELSEILFFLYSLYHISLWEWDEWPSPRDSGSLSFPSLYSLLMWLHSIFDLRWSSLFFVYSSFRYHPRHCLWFILFTSPPLFFSYIDLFLVQFFPCIILAYLIISLICFIISLLILYLHWASSGPWLTNFSIHVAFYTWGHEFFIIGYLGLVSCHFYYLISLAYVMSRVLRPPWGHGIRCRLRQPLLRRVFEIWLIFGYHHASSSERRLFDV